MYDEIVDRMFRSLLKCDAHDASGVSEFVGAVADEEMSEMGFMACKHLQATDQRVYDPLLGSYYFTYQPRHSSQSVPLHSSSCSSSGYHAVRGVACVGFLAWSS